MPDEIKPEASHAVGWLFSHAWAIQPHALETMIQIGQRNLSDFEAVAAKRDARLNENTRTVSIRGSIAVLDVNGPIFARAGFFDRISGATDVEMMAKDFQDAMDNPMVDGILLNIDSPGGEVSGTSELAQMVFNARGKKKIYAFVQGAAASGAYWIASAAEKIFMADTAVAGSVGVVMGYRNESEKNAKAGVKDIEIVSEQSPDKRLDPTTDAGRAKVQQTVNDIASVFVGTVARNRNVTPEAVVNEFGQGWLKVGEKAVQAGMADGVSTFEGVMTMMKSQRKGVSSMSGSAEEKVHTSAELEAAKSTARQEGVESGAKAERERIQAIEGIQAPGHEALIKDMKFKPGVSAGDVALAVTAAQAKVREASAASHVADATAVAALTAESGGPANPSAQQDQRKGIAAMIAAGGNAEHDRLHRAIPGSK